MDRAQQRRDEAHLAPPRWHDREDCPPPWACIRLIAGASSAHSISDDISCQALPAAAVKALASSLLRLLAARRVPEIALQAPGSSPSRGMGPAITR